MKDGYDDKSVIDEALENYFAEVAYQKTSVSYLSVGAIILGVEGVDSIDSLRINDGTADIPLATEQIAILGTTLWG